MAESNVRNLEKYVEYKFPGDKKNKYQPWNMMNFYDCKVINISVVEYEKAGKRMSIEIEAPKLKKKYYLFAWSDMGVCEAIENSHLKVGDYISVHAELSYYQNKEGRHCEAYKIIPDCFFEEQIKENPRYFKLMRIRREVRKPENQVSKGYLSKNDLLKMMLG